MKYEDMTTEQKAAFDAQQAKWAQHISEKAAVQAQRNDLLADIPDNVDSVAELRVVVADLQAAVRILAGYEK
jgi:hypothetical protein